MSPVQSETRGAHPVKAKTKSPGLALSVLVSLLLTLPACVGVVGPTPAKPSDLNGNGPFNVLAFTAQGTGKTNGFNQGTVYYPIGVDQKVGAVVTMPGYGAEQTSLAWIGNRLASHGFVVMTLDSRDLADSPTSRSEQAGAARQWLTAQAANPASPLSTVLDPYRIAYVGHSTGGTASLQAGFKDPRARAVIALAPWNPDFDTVGPRTPLPKVPTMIVGCSFDFATPNFLHSQPIYGQLTGAKSYVEVPGDHGCAHSGQPTTQPVGRYMISFLKFALDSDPRYGGFLCQSTAAADVVNYQTVIC